MNRILGYYSIIIIHIRVILKGKIVIIKQLLFSWKMFLDDLLFFTRLVTWKQYTWLLLVLRDSLYYSETLIYKFWFPGKYILGDLFNIKLWSQLPYKSEILNCWTKIRDNDWKIFKNYGSRYRHTYTCTCMS